MNFKTLLRPLVAGGIGMLCACAPKVYIIDRATIMEEESAGDWPDIEDRWKKQNAKKQAQFIEIKKQSEKKSRLTQIVESDQITK